mmetsp:Transcript_35696/g.86158  ORF Transcript_35696/g.86158 Transcript_35696/m.86158 type:complete len:142 (-) Transcript_35696:29-454(-)
MQTMATVATHCCFLAILAVYLIEFGAAFQPSNHLRVGTSRSVQFRQRHGHLNAATDPSIIASNREYLINVLGVSPNKVKTIEIRRAENNWGGSIITLEIGVLEERSAWLRNRLDLNESECKKLIQRGPYVLQKKTENKFGT